MQTLLHVTVRWSDLIYDTATAGKALTPMPYEMLIPHLIPSNTTNYSLHIIPFTILISCMCSLPLPSPSPTYCR